MPRTLCPRRARRAAIGRHGGAGRAAYGIPRVALWQRNHVVGTWV